MCGAEGAEQLSEHQRILSQHRLHLQTRHQPVSGSCLMTSAGRLSLEGGASTQSHPTGSEAWAPDL
jgi:hypothetical protein